MRLIVEQSVNDEFIKHFVAAPQAIRVGNGLHDGIQMGPLANARRLHAMEQLVADVVEQGAEIATGGKRWGGEGYFFEPTLLIDVPQSSRIMMRSTFRPGRGHLEFLHLRRGHRRGQPLALRPCCVCIHMFDGHRGIAWRRYRKWHDLDQSSRNWNARNAVWWNQRFRIRN